MKVLYLSIDERQCNYGFPIMYFMNNSKIELKTIPNKFMSKMKEKGNIDEIYSFLEKTLPECDVAVLSLEMLLYGGYLPSRIHHIPSFQLQERLKKLELLLLQKKGSNTIIYLFSNIMKTTPYSSSEDDCNYYSNYGEFIYKRSYLLDKKNNSGLLVDEETVLTDCVNMIPASVLSDYEKRVNNHEHILLECNQLIKNKVIDYLAINMESEIEFGYESISKIKIIDYYKEQNLYENVLNYSEFDGLGFFLICRAILLHGNNKIRISVLYDGVGCTQIAFLKKNNIQKIIESLGATYSTDIDNCDLVLFIHCNKIGDIKSKEKVYNDLVNLNIPFIIVDDLVNNKVDPLFIELIFKNGISDKCLAYSSSISKALASGLIQYQYGSKGTRDDILFETMLYEYAFESCVKEKYVKNLKNKSAGRLIHINDNDVVMKKNIKKDIEMELLKLYEILPYSIEAISFPWYRLDEIIIQLK